MMSAPGTPDDDPRMRAYLESIPEPKVVRSFNQSRQSGRTAVTDALREGLEMDALFCENDVLTVGAFRGLTDLGIAVPGQIRLAGCDGLEDTAYQSTPLTTLVQPLGRVCETAWNMLQTRIEGAAKDPRAVEFKATLEVRASTAG